MTPRALMVQLARLGDLVQSLPAFVSLTNRYPHRPLDLLCPATLADLARLFPDVGHVLEWDGAQWHAWADSCVGEFQPPRLCEVERYLTELTPEPYADGLCAESPPTSYSGWRLVGQRGSGPAPARAIGRGAVALGFISAPRRTRARIQSYSSLRYILWIVRGDSSVLSACPRTTLGSIFLVTWLRSV